MAEQPFVKGSRVWANFGAYIDELNAFKAGKKKTQPGISDDDIMKEWLTQIEGAEGHQRWQAQLVKKPQPVTQPGKELEVGFSTARRGAEPPKGTAKSPAPAAAPGQSPGKPAGTPLPRAPSSAAAPRPASTPLPARPTPQPARPAPKPPTFGAAPPTRPGLPGQPPKPAAPARPGELPPQKPRPK